MNEAEPSLFVDTKTAARMLGISRTLLYVLMAREEVPSKRFGHRRVIPRAWLVQQARDCVEPPPVRLVRTRKTG